MFNSSRALESPEARMPASYGRRAAIGDALVRSAGTQWAIIAGLVAVGTYLRLANLGELGFRWDEDLSSLAARAILEKGVPELPSGMVYLRSGLFLYAMAGSAALFGFSELALRLPAALCGIALIPAAFFFGRALFDVRVGLILGALVSLSYWDVEVARYARMYAPFSLFYLLTLLCIWRFRLVTTSLAGGLLCVALALVTLSLHQLGYTLAAAFFFPLAIRGPAAWRQARNWAFPVLASGLVAAFFFYWSGVVDRYRQIPAIGAADPDSLPAGGGYSELSTELMRALPELTLLPGLLENAPFLAMALVAAPVAAALVYVARRKEPLLDRGLIVLIAACCAMPLFNVALLGILALAFVKRTGLAAFRRADVQFAIGMIAITFLVWLTLAVAFDLDGEAGTGASLRAAVRALLDYPHFFIFWGYPNEWPLLSIVAAIGGLWAFDRSAQREPVDQRGSRRHEAPAFLLLALGVPLVANGMFEAPFELFRYNVPFNTFYFALVALGLLHWREVFAAARRTAWRPSRSFAAAGTALLVLLVVGFDANPLRAWLTVQRQYLNEGPLYRAFDVSRYDDFKTTAAFVTENAGPDDLIIAFDSREYFNYLGRLDYWVRTDRYEGQSYEKNGTFRDLYIDTPLIMSLDELERILATPGRTKWLLASTSALEQTTTAVSKDIRQFLIDQHRQIVYVGRDGNKNVFRF